MTPIQKVLFSMADEGYREFHSRLIPTVDKARVIGVRTPDLRKYARSLACTPEGRKFTAAAEHEYYEENNLHAFIIERIPSFDEALAETERFLPYIDNWATCDMFLPVAFKKKPPQLPAIIESWLRSGSTYTVRFAMGLLMKLYLDADFDPRYPKWVASVRSEEYYVNMMEGWYFATALAKRREDVIEYFTGEGLTPQVRAMAIKKARESNRISAALKEYLKEL